MPAFPRRMDRTSWFGGLSVLLAWSQFGCAEPSASRSPDATRATGPVPACVRNLPPAAKANGFQRQLPEDQYFGLVVPSWSDGVESPSSSTLACNGEAIFDSRSMEGTRFDPQAVEQGKITYGGGANGLKIVWLRTHQAENGDAAGPLSLVRLVDNHAEVYGVTTYRGDPERTRFDLERIGGEVALTAVVDGCTKATGECDTVLDVLRPVHGRLDPVTTIGLKRVRSATGLEPGIQGPLQISLTTSPEYKSDGIFVIEEVTVTDETGRKLRRAQLERAYLLQGANVVETRESLWTRLYDRRVGNQAETPRAPSEPGEPSNLPVE